MKKGAAQLLSVGSFAKRQSQDGKTPENGGAQRIDGRAARSVRARIAMADALLDLLDEGVVGPTAAQIAERAGVSPRLVFHHFADIEAIYATAIEQQFKRLAPLIKPVNPDLPLERRVAEFVRIRARLFERSSPVRRASVRMEPVSPQIARGLRYSHDLSRNLTRQAFSHELAALSGDVARVTANALDAIGSWENWEFLRHRAGLSRPEASRVVTLMLTALLAGGERHSARK